MEAIRMNGASTVPRGSTETELSKRLVAVDSILARHGTGKSELIGVLQEIQETYHYLPEDLLNYVATAMGLSPATVFGVATFYAQFSLEPKGKYVVRVCDGTACHVKGSRTILDAVRRKLNLSEGKITTPDRLFTVETVACLGACGLAPVMVINEKVHPQISPDRASNILDEIAKSEADGAAIAGSRQES